MSSKAKPLGDQVIVAVAHPLRIEIQRILFHREASPSEVAKELGVEVSGLAHHFKVLEAEGCIVLVKEEARRGSVEHFYKAVFPTKYDDESWAALPKPAREDISRLVLQGLFGEAVRAMNVGTFDERKERHLSWIPMGLDEQGFLDLVGREARWLEEVEQIQAEAATRLGDQEGQRVVAAILGFKTPPGFGLVFEQEAVLGHKTNLYEVPTLGPQAKLAGDRVIDTISHPLRIEIQRILFYRVASPKEVARELKVGLSRVSHHFKVLKAEGAIRLVETKPRRGAVEHFYKADFPTKYDDESWAALPKPAREDISRLVLQGLFGEAVRAMNVGTFDERKERHLSWIPMGLDEQGFLDLVGREARWLEEVEQIQAEAATRLGDQEGQRVVAAILGFKTPPGFGLRPNSS